MSEPMVLPKCDCKNKVNQVCDVCQIWLPEIDRLTAQLAKAKTANLAIRSERDQALAQLHAQLAEANNKIDGLEEMYSELYQHHAEEKHKGELGDIEVLQMQLAERDAAIKRIRNAFGVASKENKALKEALYNAGDEYSKMTNENDALRAEVGGLRHDIDYCGTPKEIAEVRKQTAQEILNEISQEEIRRILLVGDPRTTTVSSGLLTLVAELRQRYGLEG